MSQQELPKGNGFKSQWAIWAVAAVISLLAAFVGVQFQQARDGLTQNAKDLVKLEDATEDDQVRLEKEFETEIARLDESNRSRRNDIATLEERIAVLETTVTEKASGRELGQVQERLARVEAQIEGSEQP